MGAVDRADVAQEPPQIDTTVAHEARMYDYWLGGKDTYPADRALGDLIREQIPTISTMARANRAFLDRAVRYLAGGRPHRRACSTSTTIRSYLTTPW